MTSADRLSWTIARHVAALPAGSAFTATSCATFGVMLAQRLMGSRLALSGRGGAYDLHGILALHARHWLFNRRPRAHVDLPGVFATQSEPHVLMATPAQVDGKGNANLSGLGDPQRPKVAFGGTRGLPDARTVHFVLPAHSDRQLVAQADFVSTCCATRDTPSLLFTDICVMRWHGAGWVLIERAPEASVDELRARTGFAFGVAPDLCELQDMPDDARGLLAELDPLGMRELDFVTGRRAQLDAFERIYRAEAALVGRQKVPRHG